jgi:hypothetical protein
MSSRIGREVCGGRMTSCNELLMARQHCRAPHLRQGLDRRERTSTRNQSAWRASERMYDHVLPYVMQHCEIMHASEMVPADVYL